MSSDHGSGIEDTVAADIGPIAQHGADFVSARLHVLASAVDDNVLSVRLHVGCDGAGPHMSVESENTVAHIVVMRNLYLVEQNHILELRGIAHCRASSDDGAAADKRALPDSCFLIDNAGSADICAVKYLRTLCDPDILSSLFKPVLGELIAQSDNEIGDVSQNFPWICPAVEQFFRDRLVKIEQIVDRKIFKIHNSSLLFLSRFFFVFVIRVSFPVS